MLELNLMKKAWKPYGVNIEIKASGLRNVLKWGTTVNDDKKDGIRHNRSKRRIVSLSEIREERGLNVLIYVQMDTREYHNVY